MRIINSVFHFLVLVVVEEPETRDAWWNEIRTEIRSHTRAMGCHAVIGYSEQTSIWLDQQNLSMSQFKFRFISFCVFFGFAKFIMWFKTL